MNALLATLEKLKLHTKLLLGFGSGLVVAAAIGLNSLAGVATLEEELTTLYDNELLGISHIKEANINLIYMGRAMRQMMIAQDDVTRDKARAQVAAARDALRAEMAEARKRIYRDEAIARFEQFQQRFARYNENVEHAIALIEREKTNPSAAAQFVTSADFIAVVNQTDDDLTALSQIKARNSQLMIDAAHGQVDQIRLVTLLLFLAGIVLAILVGVLVGVSITRPNNRLRASVENLAGGDVAAPIPHTDYPNEIGVMARAIQVLQGIYRKAEDTRWIKAHAAEIGAAMQQANDSRALAQAAISRLAPVIDAGHGALYVAGAEQRFHLLGSYGYRERKHLNNSFALGEGLVGQAALEKASIVLSAPKDYIRINSGLGEGPPACIAVLPILLQERVLGVLEIASFRQFDERETALLDTLMPVLATSMEIMDRSQRTRELLASTQEQAERMEKQAAQLEEQQVEMEAQQAELLETENWFRSIIESAPDGMMVIDETGAILLANASADALFGYAGGELLGTHSERLFPNAQRLAAGPGTRTLRARRSDGSEFDVETAVNVLPARGHRGRCLSVSVRAV